MFFSQSIFAGRPGSTGDVFDVVPKFRAMLTEAGRDPASCPVSLSGAPDDLDTLKRFADLGVVRVSVSLAAATEEAALPILDKWAKLITRV